MKKKSLAALAIPVIGFACANARAGSYTTSLIPTNGMDLLAWSFQAEHLNSIFANIDFGTTVYVISNGNYVASEYFSSWSPDLILHPGDAFFLVNAAPNARTYTVTGTNLTSASYSIPLTNANQWYGVFNAYLATNNYVECIVDKTNSPPSPLYTHTSWNYNSSTNDLVYQWSVQNQAWVGYKVVGDPFGVMNKVYTNVTANLNLLYGTSPGVCTGKGLFISPAVGKTWVQYPQPTCCDTNCRVSSVSCTP